MIVTILFFVFIGFGAYDTLTYKEPEVICEEDKQIECRGFDKEIGFKRPTSIDNINDIDFDSLDDSDFITREPAENDEAK